MLQIIWRNPETVKPAQLRVSRLLSREASQSEVRSLYRSVSQWDEVVVLYELLISSLDPICAA